MSAWWPVLQDRLVVLLTTLLDPAWIVFDGPRYGREKGAKQYALVGTSVEGEAGSYDQPDSSVDTFREESGAVLVHLVCWSGDVTGLPTSRATVFTAANAIEAAVRADQRLGVLPDASSLTLSATPSYADDGASGFLLLLSFRYFVQS